ncbi:hypothetical protein NMY22_g765 [Coprinellus aureogranulatus]|nr:hypothetical protein NMY22_g765 [Coprinellus aureogranulatus]
MSSLADALGDTQQYHNRGGQDLPMPGQVSNASLSEDAGDSDEEMGDLFGNDDVEDFRAERSASPTASAAGSQEGLASPERERRQALEYGEDDLPAQDIPSELREAEVSFPNLPVPRSSDGDTWVIRTPNFMSIDSKPFHPDTYIGPDQEDEEAADNAKERSMTIKLRVENTMRWRWAKDENGADKRQSNARIVRWSDGSLSLRLGKEIFDVTKTLDHSASAPRQLGASSQPASQTKPAMPGKSQGLTYLVAQHKRSQVLQAEAVITGFMGLRPTGMQSEAHRMLVRAVGQKHNKVARLKMTDEPKHDPEREKAELVKQSSRKTRKREDDGLGGGRRRRYSRRTAEHDVWSDDEDEGPGQFAGSDGEEGGSRRSSPKKGKRKADDDDHVGGGYQEDDFLVADDSEDEDGGYNKKRKKARDDYEEDPLDKIDRQIEANNRRDNKDDADAMDVESEEEDDDVPVRRTGGTRRRAAINFDEEEE